MFEHTLIDDLNFADGTMGIPKVRAVSFTPLSGQLQELPQAKEHPQVGLERLPDGSLDTPRLSKEVGLSINVEA